MFLDSRVRGNDNNGYFLTFYRGIKIKDNAETFLTIEDFMALCNLFLPGRLSENEKFFARSRKAKILTAGIH